MNFFFDTEFIEDGKTIDLISIGIVAESGKTYYAISTEFKASKADQWVKDNVIAKLPPRYPVHTMNGGGSPRLWEEGQAWRSRSRIAEDIRNFVGVECKSDDSKPIFWAAWAAYDWVAFCQLFGKMINLPAMYPYYCRDVIQWADQLGLGREALPPSPDNEHHALADALWVKQSWEILKAHSEAIAP